MRKKQKIILFFIVICVLFSIGQAQYYYFSDSYISNFNGYQQGCNEELDVRFDTEAGVAGAGIFHLVLDNTKINYSGNAEGVLIETTTLSFPDWVSGFPKWKVGSSNTILESERYNQSDVTSTVQGNLGYGTVHFLPQYSGGLYSVDFGMDYTSGHIYTTETTLSYGGSDIIDPLDQDPRLVTTINIEQKPCLNDIRDPDIKDTIYTGGSTKVVNFGLNINLTDATGDGDIPYVWTGGVWTGSAGGNIWGTNNQYGINSGTVSVTVAGNGTSTILDYDDFSRTAIDEKTRQDKDRDYNIIATSGQLFAFGIEKEITISYTIEDRLGHTHTESLYFNREVPAVVTNIYPVDNQRFVILDDEIRFKISDDWAGVDSGSVVVTLSGLDNNYFGIYSGIDLNFSGVVGSADFPDYDVILSNHIDFPTSGIINVNVYGMDLENNGGDLANWDFTTRPDCGELSCCSMKLQTGNETTQFDYMNNELYISGGKNAYLTGFGSLTGYINCNTTDEGLSIYKGHGDNNTGVFVGFHDLSQLRFEGNNVKAVLSGNTMILTKITTTPPPGGGGGGGGIVPKDDCPDGDNSPSYYDGSCGGHSSPGICDINNSNYSTILKGAYLYSYLYGITTMCPIQDANLDGYLNRNHFAKMASEFAINVLGKEPDVGKAGCNDFDDISGDTEELRGFIKTACELSLMGLHSDGITPKDSFYSELYVTRAQFGTVFSRLLFEGEYNIKNEAEVYKDKGYWYNDHLNALKDYGIMTMIHDPWPESLELRGYVMLMMQRADNYGLFAGMIPVLNGVDALFD